MSDYSFLEHLGLPVTVYQGEQLVDYANTLGNAISSAMKQASYISDDSDPQDAKDLAELVDEIDTAYSHLFSHIEDMVNYIGELENNVDEYQSEIESRLTAEEKTEIEEEQILRKLKG